MGVGVETVTIKQIHVVEVHTLEALVETRHQILARAPLTIGTRPHIVSRLCGDKELVAIWAEVIHHKATECLLSSAEGWAVVICKVEVRNAVVESVVSNGSATLIGVYATEVMPEAEAHLWQQHTTATTTLVDIFEIIVAALTSHISLLKIHSRKEFFSYIEQIPHLQQLSIKLRKISRTHKQATLNLVTRRRFAAKWR